MGKAGRVPRHLAPGAGGSRQLLFCMSVKAKGHTRLQIVRFFTLACVSQARRHASRCSMRALSSGWPLHASP